VKGTGMSKILKRFKSVVSLLGEFWAFMRMQKKWWLAPLILILVLMGMLIILTEGSALAPFIYALF
jgi:type IV secretory pathway TrbL component